MLRVLTLAIILLLSFSHTAHAFLGFGGKHEKVRATDGVVTLPVASLADGKAHFYTYAAEGGDVRFFMLKSPDGKVRAALDACDVCFHAGKGYEQKNDRLRCINCGMEFHANRVGDLKGGCNPHPLPFTLEGDTVRIATSELAAGLRYFPAAR